MARIVERIRARDSAEMLAPSQRNMRAGLLIF